MLSGKDVNRIIHRFRRDLKTLNKMVLGSYNQGVVEMWNSSSVLKTAISRLVTFMLCIILKIFLYCSVKIGNTLLTVTKGKSGK